MGSSLWNRLPKYIKDSPQAYLNLKNFYIHIPKNIAIAKFAIIDNLNIITFPKKKNNICIIILYILY